MSLPYSNRCNMFPHRPPTCIKLLLMEFRPYNSSLVFLRLSMAWAGKKLNLIFFFINSMSGPQLIRFNYPFPSSPDHTYAWVHLIAIWVLKKSKWMIRTTPNHFFFFFKAWSPNGVALYNHNICYHPTNWFRLLVTRQHVLMEGHWMN